MLSSLAALERLRLRSISTDDLRYIGGLNQIWSLEVKLGGIRDLTAIEGKECLKYLELWQIRGLRDLRVISSLSGLQYLFLQALRNVIAVPDVSKLLKLGRIHFENMQALLRKRAKPVSIFARIHSRFRSKHEARTICPSVQDSDFAKRACSFWQQKEESAIRKHDAAIRHNAIPRRQVCFRMSRPNYALQPSPVVSDRNLTFLLSVKYSQVTVRNSAALSTGRRRRGSRCVPRNRGALHRAT